MADFYNTNFGSWTASPAAFNSWEAPKPSKKSAAKHPPAPSKPVVFSTEIRAMLYDGKNLYAVLKLIGFDVKEDGSAYKIELGSAPNGLPSLEIFTDPWSYDSATSIKLTYPHVVYKVHAGMWVVMFGTQAVVLPNSAFQTLKVED